MAVAAPLLIAQIAFAGFGAMQQMKSASKAAELQGQASAANASAADAEFSRQQAERNRVASEEKSDRQRQFDKDLATVRVASAEGFAMGDRLAGEVAYIGGIDLSRIEENRKADIVSLQSRKVAAATGAQQDIQASTARAKAAQQSAFLGVIGSGVQIYANDQHRKTIEGIAKNRKVA